MKEFKFNFLNGFYLVSVVDDIENNQYLDLQTLVDVQHDLRVCLPHREREIDSFILSCVNDVVNGVSPQK